MSITMIGLDTAKSVFQVHAVDEAGKAEIRAQAAPERADPVLREAGGLHGRHGGVRCGASLGPRADRPRAQVKLIAPEAVKPFVKKGKKNDAADAAAICEAASRPDVRFVPVKSLEQQGILALHSARSLLVKQQTMLANAMRGLATEFGLTVPKGIGKLEELVALVDADEALPKQAQAGDRRIARALRAT